MKGVSSPVLRHEKEDSVSMRRDGHEHNFPTSQVPNFARMLILLLKELHIR